VAEYCFSVPAEQLFSGGVTRRLARRAMADRLPQSVLHGPRGYQYADWYEGLNKSNSHAALDELEAGAAAPRLLDFPTLRALVDSWPTDDWASLPVIVKYRTNFLMALSAASFANRMVQAPASSTDGVVAGSSGSG
jgi:hypothetical protein